MLDTEALCKDTDRTLGCRHGAQPPAPPSPVRPLPDQAGAWDGALGGAGSKMETNGRNTGPRTHTRSRQSVRGRHLASREAGQGSKAQGRPWGGHRHRMRKWEGARAQREGSSGHHPGPLWASSGQPEPWPAKPECGHRVEESPAGNLSLRSTSKLCHQSYELWRPPQGDPKKPSFPGEKDTPENYQAMPPPPLGP